ncbi:MAG: class I SAM-dependent methyltransferase [Alphaproteobacteria bacterium]|nr:class I SAM-dependent methyltransferase [Alphaproteobacteria bacterium]
MTSVSASFRDPSGFIFKKDGLIYRQINECYKDNWQKFIDSGLYDKLVSENMLIRHDDVSKDFDAYKVIRPEMVDFISYPYEWSFSQYKDAALLTLNIQKTALEYGMSLKDASAYNVQFHKGKPVFIDTLSFEILNEKKPWVAYGQFCRHFLAPIALMAKQDIRLSSLMKNYIDGIPLDLADKLLPCFSGFGLYMNIHLHAKSQKKYESVHDGKVKELKFSKSYHKAIVNGLISLIESLKFATKDTEWGDYYTFTNYDDKAQNSKENLVKDFIKRTKSLTLWDIGANNGYYSRMASDTGIKTVAFDIDPIAVEKNYRQVKKNKEENILPLIMDLTNPSPAIGWNLEERSSVVQRGKADTVMALALIHHLAISNNLPFKMIAKFLAAICKNLIIEFVPKNDSQVQKLLSTREDIFPGYDIEHFEADFGKYFKIIHKETVSNSVRTLYLFKVID